MGTPPCRFFNAIDLPTTEKPVLKVRTYLGSIFRDIFAGLFSKTTFRKLDMNMWHSPIMLICSYRSVVFSLPPFPPHNKVHSKRVV